MTKSVKEIIKIKEKNILIFCINFQESLLKRIVFIRILLLLLLYLQIKRTLLLFRLKVVKVDMYGSVLRLSSLLLSRINS